jgi:CRISPR-associated protein Csm1
LNWDEEFAVVEKLKNELVRLIENEKEPSALLSKIRTHAANSEIKAHEIKKIKTYWMLTYDLSRFKDRTKNADTQRLLNNCIKEVCGNKSLLNGKPIKTDYHPLELWAFAARWAELELRS